MKIAIVILNWNGRDLLEKFLPSVVKYSLEDAEVYVADNNSTDESISPKLIYNYNLLHHNIKNHFS